MTIAVWARWGETRRLEEKLWFLYGAPLEALERVGASLEPNVYDAGSLLCDAPRDPCATLSFVVLGSVSALRGSSEDECVMEKLTTGAAFGLSEVLPLPAAGTMEAAIRARQCPLRKVRANEYTVVLELQRELRVSPSRGRCSRRRRSRTASRRGRTR